MIYGPKKQIIINLLRDAPATIPEIAAVTGSTLHRTASMLYWLRLQGAVRPTDKTVPKPAKRGPQVARLWEAV